MSYTTFLQLKNELLTQIGATPSESDNHDAADGPGSAELNVDGVSVMLVEMLGGKGEHAMLCADCGEIPQDLESDIQSQVLTMNLLMYRDNGATFCTDPTSGHLLLLTRIALANADVPALLAMAKQFAKGVQQYRRDHFLSGREAAQPQDMLHAFARL